jgi:hypothetical protein
MAFLGGYVSSVLFPSLVILVDNLFEPFFDVAPHGRHVDFMPDFYIEEFTFQVP